MTWLTEKINAASDHARPGTCTRCGAQVLRARAGHTAALDVVADPDPVEPIQEIQALLSGRLTWHLVTTALGARRITWRGPTAIRSGPARHLVIADHVCPPQPVQERLM